MKNMKYFLAGAALGTYIFFPPYRYYVIGSWVAYKIIKDKQRCTVIPKSSKIYKRIMGVA